MKPRYWLGFSSDPQTIKELKRIAQADSRSMSQVIRLAVKQYIDKPVTKMRP